MSKAKRKQPDPSHRPVLQETVQPDPKILEMTQEEAMEYFELPVWAKREDLDDRFWKLGKIYKAQKDEQKLADIAAAYNIANGTRDRLEKEKKEEESAKHYFGKTKKQWAEFWHYEWWKFVIAAGALILIIACVQYFFLSPKNDLRVVSIGHFTVNTDTMEMLIKDQSDFKHPDVNYADIVPADEAKDAVDVYTMEIAASMLALRPTMVVFDMVNAPSYVYSETLAPVDDMYEEMKRTFTEQEMSYIEPFVYSKAKFVEEYKDELLKYESELPELTEEEKKDHVYGFIIRDEIVQRGLGYTINLKSGDKGIVFGINAGGDKVDETKELEMKLLKMLQERRDAYLEFYPYIEQTD